MQHLGVGEGDRGLTPDRRARPVDLRIVALEDLGKRDLGAAANRFPICRLLRVFDNLDHVVARAEAELFQRHFG